MIKPLFEMFRMSMLNRPEGSRKEARDHFIEQMKTSPEFLEKLAADYFDRKVAVWSLEKAKMGYKFQNKNQAVTSVDDVRKQRAESKKRVDAVFDKINASFDQILLDLVMPDGKRLRYATGAECQKAGGFYRAVGACIKPTQVVDKHMTEQNLRDIRARFYQRNKEMIE